MKKFLPFLFPLVSLAIVIFLAFRWYSDRTERGNITPFAEDVEIEELASAEGLTGVGDYSTVDMSGEDDQSGQIRYEVKDGKVRFSVTANVENSPNDNYQVWLKDPNSEAVRKAFSLEYIKGGMSGTAAISAETLPFEVLVSKDATDSAAPQNVILRGLVEGDAEAAEAECDDENCVNDLEELTL